MKAETLNYAFRTLTKAAEDGSFEWSGFRLEPWQTDSYYRNMLAAYYDGVDPDALSSLHRSE